MQVARSAETPPLIDRPNAASGPTQVSTEIWVVDIISVDSAQQTFTADIAVVLRWKDPRLAHTTAGLAHYGLDQIWHPRVVIVNETNTVTRRLPESVEVTSDGTVVYRQRYVGPFTQLCICNRFLSTNRPSAFISSLYDIPLTRLILCRIKIGSMPA
jgi:hypothetical protein